MGFVAYFDASGGRELVGKVIAGHVSRVEDWERFDFDWKMVLAHDKVPYFHMREFAHCKGPFKGWKGQDARRANFLSRLIGVIKDNLKRRITTIVLNQDYQEVNEKFSLSEIVEGPYALAARTSAGKIRRWMGREGYSEPLEIYFEDGDTDVNIGRLRQEFKKDGLRPPHFIAKKDEHGNWLTPFQAADLAAWEFLKLSKLAEEGMLRSLSAFRKPLIGLSKVSADDGVYVKSDLIRLCERARIPERAATGNIFG